MLVLTRKVGQSVFIGDDIQIKILDVQSGRIRIGIDAPIDVVVLREELRDKPLDPEGETHGSE